MLATLFAQQSTKHCSCKQCRHLCSCDDCNDITLYTRIRNTMSVVQTIYETGSLHKTKGGNNSIIHYYFKQFYNNVFDKLRCAVHMKQYGCIPTLKPFSIYKNPWIQPKNPWIQPKNPWIQPNNPWIQPKNPWIQPKFYNYRTTDFSWPTRSRVFNIMSKPASSIFLQNATSSLHISTSSTPSFPRIL